jgi:hypothetical protein
LIGTSEWEASFTYRKGEQARKTPAIEYKHVLVSNLLKKGKRLLGSLGITPWVIPEDNDPTHKKASKKALRQ